jgi:hypothetical protein
VFENRVLKRIFGPKRGEVTRGWGNCIMRSFITCIFAKYNKNVQVKEVEMGRACSTNGGRRRNTYRILAGKPEGKKQLGRSRHRWVSNIKMDLRKNGVVWTGLI